MMMMTLVCEYQNMLHVDVTVMTMLTITKLTTMNNYCELPLPVLPTSFLTSTTAVVVFGIVAISKPKL